MQLENSFRVFSDDLDMGRRMVIGTLITTSESKDSMPTRYYSGALR